MNNLQKQLIEAVICGKQDLAYKAAVASVNSITTKSDTYFKEIMLKEIEKRDQPLVTLPDNLKNILILEQYDTFPIMRYLERECDQAVVNTLQITYSAAADLQERGIHYVPSAIFWGRSGCGKTMLAKYVAYKMRLPFAYIRFASMFGSLLGETNKKLSLIFNFIRQHPCVLCIDEIDMIGIQRGSLDVGEVNRICIGLMQELDAAPNNVIVIATTNRMDAIDDALKRRFSFKYHCSNMNAEEQKELTRKIFHTFDMTPPDEIINRTDSSNTADNIFQNCLDWYIQNKYLKNTVDKVDTIS